MGKKIKPPTRDEVPAYGGTPLGWYNEEDFEGDYDRTIEALLNGTRLTPAPIGHILPEQARAIGAKTRVVLLSSYTATKVAVKGREEARYGGSALQCVPQMLMFGECRKIDAKRLLFLWSRIEKPERPYKAVVKATADKTKLFLESVYRIKPTQIRGTLAKTEPMPSRMYPPTMRTPLPRK